MKSSIALCFRVKETQKFEYISRKHIIGLKKLHLRQTQVAEGVN